MRAQATGPVRTDPSKLHICFLAWQRTTAVATTTTTAPIRWRVRSTNIDTTYDQIRCLHRPPPARNKMASAIEFGTRRWLHHVAACLPGLCMACVCVCVRTCVCVCLVRVRMYVLVCVCASSNNRIPGPQGIGRGGQTPDPPRKRSPPSPEGVHAKQQASSFGVSDAAVGFGMASATNAPH